MPQKRRLRPIWKPAGAARRSSAAMHAAIRAATRRSPIDSPRQRGSVQRENPVRKRAGNDRAAGNFAAGYGKGQTIAYCRLSCLISVRTLTDDKNRSSVPLRLRTLLARWSLGEVQANGAIDVGAGEADGTPLVLSDCLHQFENVQRIAGP